MPVVTLTPDDWDIALRLASARAVESLRSDRQDAVWTKATWIDEHSPHLGGAIGEIAFAKWTDTYPTCTVRNFRGDRPDATYKGVEVELRWRSKPWYELIVREHDSDDSAFVLMRGGPPEVEVVGWTFGFDAKRPQFLQQHGSHASAYFVPDSELRQMEELRG